MKSFKVLNILEVVKRVKNNLFIITFQYFSQITFVSIYLIPIIIKIKSKLLVLIHFLHYHNIKAHIYH